jgi:hypothetical protein
LHLLLLYLYNYPPVTLPATNFYINLQKSRLFNTTYSMRASHKHLEIVKYFRSWTYQNEIAGNDSESIIRARNLHITPEVRQLYKLQVECLIVISRELHRHKGPTALTYYIQDPKEENLSHTPRPVGFDLTQYTQLQLARYIKPRIKN